MGTLMGKATIWVVVTASPLVAVMSMVPGVDGAGSKVRAVVDAVSDLHKAKRTGELVTLTKECPPPHRTRRP
jgi:hypothetical protein